MRHLTARPWVPAACEARVQTIAAETARADDSAVDARIESRWSQAAGALGSTEPWSSVTGSEEPDA